MGSSHARFPPQGTFFRVPPVPSPTKYTPFLLNCSLIDFRGIVPHGTTWASDDHGHQVASAAGGQVAASR